MQLTGNISWKRIILITAALLLISSIAASQIASHYEQSYGNWCQLPTGSTKGILEWYIKAEQESANSIALVGDSRMNSYYLPSPSDSIPCAYQKHAGNATKVVSLSLDGSRLGDEYLLSKLAMGNGKPAITSIGYNLFLPKEGASEIMYKEITKLNGITNEDLALSELKPPRHEQFEQQIGTILRLWPVYSHKSEFQTALFGGHPKKYLKGKFMGMLCAIRGKECKGGAFLYTPFPELSAEEQGYIIKTQVADYERPKGFNITSTKSYKYVEKLADYANKTRANLFIYATPINWELINRTGLLSYEEYAQDMKAVSRMLAAKGIPFADYNQPIRYRSSDFHDFSHLTAEGNEKFATELYEDTQKVMRNGRAK